MQMLLSGEREWVLPVPFLFFMYLCPLNFLLWVEEIKKPRKVKSSKVLLAKAVRLVRHRQRKPLLRKKRKRLNGWMVMAQGVLSSIHHYLPAYIESCRAGGLVCPARIPQLKAERGILPSDEVLVWSDLQKPF